MFDKLGRGLITWRELSSLMKALGIPDIPLGLLHRMAAEHTPENSVGLDYKSFLHLLHSDPFTDSLDYTYNRHNSTYNVRVIKKALALLVEAFLSLEDIRASRMGFTLYEGETCNGIQLEAVSVAAAMRVTGKAIAPKKLQAWLDSVEEDVPGRLQLYEFLELVKLCNDRNEQAKAIQNVSTSVERSRAGLFELTDPNFLLTPNQKLSKHMDDDYESMVNLMNSQQIPPRETAISAKSSSPDFHNYALHSRRSKRVEESLDLYGQIRESIKSSASNVQATRATNSTSTPVSSRPRPASSLLLDRKSKPPSLRLSSSSLRAVGRRSTSAPSMRSVDSQKMSRVSDVDSVNFDPGRERDVVPRHMTASAPLLRGSTKDRLEGIDDAEFAIPARKLDNYGALRDYIVSNGEASLARVVTSSIGAIHKHHHGSPPSSPHPTGKADDRKKKPKPKRAFEEARKNAKNLQNIYKDHRHSMDSLANNLEDIINNNKPHNSESIAKVQSTVKRSTMANIIDDTDVDLPSSLIPAGVEVRPRSRPRSSADSPSRITFQLASR